MNERENALLAYHHKKPEWIPLSFDCIMDIGFAGGNECGLVSEDHRDIFGIPWQIVKDPTPDPNVPPLIQNIEDWRDVVKFPQPKTWDWKKIRDMELANYDGSRVLIWFCEQGLFDRLTVLCGFENALCWLLTDPEEVSELLGKIADFKIELIECVAEYIKPDVFMYTDDLCNKNGPFMSPDTYREVIKPHHARIIEAIKKTDMIAEQHCCGKYEALLPDFVEIGIESIFPSQASNDIAKILQEYGDRLTIVGGYNSQGAPGRIDASEKTIQEEADRIVDHYGQYGSFICMPMIMDTKANWAIYEGSPLQQVFRNEFYSRCNRD